MASPRQPDLLDWRPPEPVRGYRTTEVQAATLAQKISRAVALTLSEHRGRREDVAKAMSDFLGAAVSKNMLDAYASQAREVTLSVERLAALIFATGDRRLLELIAEQFGWCVIERRWLRLIELAAVTEHAEEMARRAQETRRAAKREGLL